jgi:probable phosphoglycerate mutase
VTDRDGPAADDGYRQYRFKAPPGATQLFVVRHGESAPERSDASFPLVDGRADPELDPRGRAEADLVAERLADQDIAAIYVTPLRRTVQTAAPLAARLGLTPAVERALVEVHLGEWEAKFRRKMAEQSELAVRMMNEERWDVIPGAETNEQLAARARAGLERIAAAHPDEKVVVVTHGGVIATMLAIATGGRPFAFLGADNASISHLVITDTRWIVRRFNDTGHLGTDLDRPPEPLT